MLSIIDKLMDISKLHIKYNYSMPQDLDSPCCHLGVFRNSIYRVLKLHDAKNSMWKTRS